MQGLIIKGSKNLFTLKPVDAAPSTAYIECRLKSKTLKLDGGFYNPLAPGDVVEFNERDSLIESLVARRNKFSRWNVKGRSSQILAANIDIVLCVTSPREPPWRPRFIDRVLLQSEAENIEAAIVLNKSDLPFDKTDEERLNYFEQLGIKIFRISAKTGEGIKALSEFLIGKPALLIGQSGVGKSSILNRLFPETNSRTGGINKKFDRGSHTTVLSVLYESDALSVIDSPGVRQFIPDGISPAETALYMRDIAPFAIKCYFGASCTHTHEEGCAILAAVQEGLIHPDRYNSFLKLSGASKNDGEK